MSLTGFLLEISEFRPEGCDFYHFTTFFSAIIVPYGKAPDEQIEDHEYWVGKIKEIRSRNGDPSEVGPDVFANPEC